MSRAPRLRNAVVPGAIAVLAVALLLAGGSAGADATTGNGTTNVTVYDGSNTSLTDATAIDAAIANGTLERTDKLVAGQTLVVAIESDRLATDMAARNGTTTERFLDVLAENATFRLAQTNPTTHRPRKVVSLGPRNTSVSRVGNTTYALLDTGRFDYRLGGIDENRTDSLLDGERFAVVFGYDRDERDLRGPEVELFTTPAEMRVRGPLAPELVNESVTVNVEAERSLFVRVQLSDETITAPVEDVPWTNGVGVSLDLRGVDSGTPYTLDVVHDGTVVDSHNGTVVEPRATIRDPSVTVADDQTYVNVTVSFSHAGLVLVLDADGRELGSAFVRPVSELESNDTTVSVRLRKGGADNLHLQAVRGVRSTGLDPYPGPDANATLDVSDRALPVMTPPSVTSTVTPTTPTPADGDVSTPTPADGDVSTPGTSPATPTDTPSPTDTRSPGTTTTETPGSGGPGFDIAVTLAAILSLLAGLRRA
jgi:hypothetical protein